MSVLPNGQIWVGWNDRRDDANNFLSKWYQAHSDDEGTTWLDINNAPVTTSWPTSRPSPPPSSATTTAWAPAATAW
jgi:hypothetical protein